MKLGCFLVLFLALPFTAQSQGWDWEDSDSSEVQNINIIEGDSRSDAERNALAIKLGETSLIAAEETLFEETDLMADSTTQKKPPTTPTTAALRPKNDSSSTPETIVVKDEKLSPPKNKPIFDSLRRMSAKALIDTAGFPDLKTLRKIYCQTKKIVTFEKRKNTERSVSAVQDMESFLESIPITKNDRERFLVNVIIFHNNRTVPLIVELGKMVNQTIPNPLRIQGYLITQCWDFHPHHKDGNYIPILNEKNAEKLFEKISATEGKLAGN